MRSAVIALSMLASACNAASIYAEGPGYDGRVPAAPDAGAADAGALGGAPLFRPHIQRDLESTGCPACHSDGTFPFRVIESPSSDAEWRASYEEAIARVGDGTSAPLVDRPLGGDGHPVVLRADSEVPSRWRQWIRDGAPYDSADDPPPATRDGGTTEDEPVTWPAVQGIFSTNDCMRCHGDAGGYSLETFEDAMGPGSDDVPNVIAGDPDSVLLRYCRNGHQGIGYRDALMVLAWIIEWNARAE